MKKEYDVKIDWWGYNWEFALLNMISGAGFTILYGVSVFNSFGAACTGFDEAGRFILGVIIFGAAFFIPNALNFLLNVIFARRYVKVDVPVNKRSRK